MPGPKLNISAAKAATQPVYDWLRGTVKEMQQPKDDNWLKAVILGGLGGTMEALLPEGPEESLQNQLSLGSNVAAPMMVRMPDHLVERFADNMIKTTTEDLHRKGQRKLADAAGQALSENRQVAGNLQYFDINPSLPYSGQYSPELYAHETLADVEKKIGMPLEDYAEKGFSAPSDNMIEINPHTLVGQNPPWIVPVKPLDLSRHEIRHGRQDLDRVFGHPRFRNYPYYVHPNEIDANAAEKLKENDPKYWAKLLNEGKERYLQDGSVTPRRLREFLFGSWSELERRRRGLPQGRIPTIPADIFDFLSKGLP